MELNTVRDAFDRVAKKQKVSSSKSQEVIDQVGHEIEQTVASMQSTQDSSTPVDQKSILAALKTKLNTISPHNQLEGSQKELNVNLNKCSKVLEKVFNPDISKAYRNVDFDIHILNQIIANHFYREGLFDAADCLIKEAGEPEAISLKCQFVEMHQIIEAVRSRNLEPALNWVSANREKLTQVGCNLELKLRTLCFVEILQKKSRNEALNYARTYLAPFASVHMHEVQKLMGCLLWAGKLEKSPYSDITDITHWEKLVDELIQHFCSFMGQSSSSALGVAIAAGVEGLPTLLKLANVMAVKKQEWQAMKQLPVPVDIGREFQFHSIFVCPVSRDQSNDNNPPMLLPCGHVLCNQSIVKMSRKGTRTFKCPYCPQDATVSECRQLYL